MEQANLEKNWGEMTTEEQLKEGVDLALKLAHDHFDPKDEELPFGMALVNKDARTGEGLPGPGLVAIAFDPTFLSSREMKERLIESIQKLTRESDALYMIFMCRAWSVTTDNPNKIKGSLEHRKDKKEIKMVIVDHRTLGSQMWIAPIEGEGDQSTLGKFELAPDGEGRLVGTFFDRKSN